MYKRQDEAAGKVTLISLWGEEKARAQMNDWQVEAKNLLEPFGEKAQNLSGFVDFMATRSS